MKKPVFYAMVLAYILTSSVAVQAATVIIDPSSQDGPTIGKELTVGVRIEDVTDLLSYQFNLAFDSTALKFSAIQEEEFLKMDGATTFAFLALSSEVAVLQNITPDAILEVNSAGVLTIVNTRLSSATGVDGVGTLVTLTFEVLEGKTSALELKDVILADSDVQPIDSDVANGTIAFAANISPVADAGGNKSLGMGDSITFDGSASRDEDGNIASYSWDFGDGDTATGATVSHVYQNAGSYTVTLTVTDNDGDTGVNTIAVSVSESLLPVIKEHSSGSPMLVLRATYNEANVHGHTYIDIWQGNILIEEGQFLEFQLAMFSGNPVFSGTVDLHTSDGSTLGIMDAKDQNDVIAHSSADLSEHARDQWYHRKISLDALAGKTLDGVMIATDSDEHSAGIFRVYVDNIQITDGEHILTSIYIDEDKIPITNSNKSTVANFVGTENMRDYSVSIANEIAVMPAGKLTAPWGSIKIQ